MVPLSDFQVLQEAMSSPYQSVKVSFTFRVWEIIYYMSRFSQEKAVMSTIFCCPSLFKVVTTNLPILLGIKD